MQRFLIAAAILHANIAFGDSTETYYLEAGYRMFHEMWNDQIEVVDLYAEGTISKHFSAFVRPHVIWEKLDVRTFPQSDLEGQGSPRPTEIQHSEKRGLTLGTMAYLSENTSPFIGIAINYIQHRFGMRANEEVSQLQAQQLHPEGFVGYRMVLDKVVFRVGARFYQHFDPEKYQSSWTARIDLLNLGVKI